MNPANEDTKKRPINYLSGQTGGLKQVPSANSLLSQAKTDKKLLDGATLLAGISKEKQNDKIHNIDRKGIRQLTQECIVETRKTSTMLNFKTMNKNPSSNAANDKWKDKKDKQTRVEQKEIVRIGGIQGISDAITLNVNIQNMIQTKKSEPKNESERFNITSATNEEKERKRDKMKKISPRGPTKQRKPKTSQFGLNQFECDEVMEIPQKSVRIVTTNPPADCWNRYEMKQNNIMFKNIALNPKNDRNPELELKQFDSCIEKYNMQSEQVKLVFISNRQAVYKANPRYIDLKQKNFSWYMRAVLAEWMMHVHSEYLLKRDTYHTAVVLTDLYFTLTPNIPKGQFQLVGAAAMYIAAKLEELQPLPVAKFATSAGGKYSTSVILEMQTRICKGLKWQLNPPTIYTWANRIMKQWDDYIEESDYAKNHPLLLFLKKQKKEAIFFKKAQSSSYMHFRQMMQLIDCSILDIQTFQYQPRMLVCSFMYLLIGKEIGEFPVKKIYLEFPSKSTYLLDDQNMYNDLFRNFIDYSFAISLADLLPEVQYCASYFILPMSYEQPKQIIDDNRSMNIEEYTSYQTYNSHSLPTIKKRNRGI